jgi:hypothetical protein
MGFVPSYSYSDWINQFPRLEDHGKHARLNLRSVKLFSDGWKFSHPIMRVCHAHID